MNMKLLAAIITTLILNGCASQPEKTSGTTPSIWSNPFEQLKNLAMKDVQNYSIETSQFLKINDQQKALSTATEAVRYKLKDPNSALFRNIRIVNYLNGQVICGEVNSKNSYGGYVGFTQFVASPTDSTLLSTSSRYESSNDAVNAGLYAACGK